MAIKPPPLVAQRPQNMGLPIENSPAPNMMTILDLSPDKLQQKRQSNTPADNLHKLRSGRDLRPLSSKRSYKGRFEDERINQYLALRMKHQKIDADKHIKGYNKMNATKAFLINIAEVQNISLADTHFGEQAAAGAHGSGMYAATQATRDAKYEVEYHCTLYSNQVNGYHGFYGRTYISKPKLLVKSEQNPALLQVQDEDFIFFHTSFVEQTSKLVIEVVVTRTVNHVRTKASAGFVVCDIFDVAQCAVKPQIVLVQKGSPRMQGTHQTKINQSNRAGQSTLTFQNREFKPFDVIKKLVPQNCLVGQSDIIPGLQEDQFPKPRENATQQLKETALLAIPKKSIYLHNLKLSVSPAFESNFEAFLKRVTAKQEGDVDISMIQHVNIQKRDIKVQINNSWKDEDTETVTALEPPDQNGICRSTGSLLLNRYFEHNLVALCFRVDYQAILPIKSGAIRESYVVGWEIFMPTMINSKEIHPMQKIDFFCKQGPGVSAMKDLLWSTEDLGMDHFNLRISGQLSTESAAPEDEQAYERVPEFGGRGMNNLINVQRMDVNDETPRGQQAFQKNDGAFPQQIDLFGQKQPLSPSELNEFQSLQSIQANGIQLTPAEQQKLQTLELQVYQYQKHRLEQLQGQQNRLLPDQIQEMQKLTQELQKFDEKQMHRMSRGTLQDRTQPQSFYQRPGTGQYLDPSSQFGFTRHQSPQTQYDYMQQTQYSNMPPGSFQPTPYSGQLPQTQPQPYNPLVGGYDPNMSQQMQFDINKINQGMDNILREMQRKDQMRADQIQSNQRVGQQDYEFQSQQQIQMIGNVFYNMLTMIGQRDKDTRLLDLSKQVKEMMQTSQFDNLMGPKVPHLKTGVMNLLKVVDLPMEDQVQLIKLGYGDLLQQPGAQVRTEAAAKDRISIEAEAQDPLRASTISFKFVCYKPSLHAKPEDVPKRLLFQMRFFSFPEIRTDAVALVEPGISRQVQEVRPGHAYYLAKDRMVEIGHGNVQRQMVDTLSDPDMLSVTYDIDPSISKIENENEKLALYMKERYLNVDIYDAETKFLFGCCKIPLFELLRQQRTNVVRAKECEACAPDSSEMRGSIQIIMSNQGRNERSLLIPDASGKVHQPHSQTLDEKLRSRAGLQPSQNQHGYKKIVRSKPMDLTRVQQTNNPANEEYLGGRKDGLSQSLTGAKVVEQSYKDLSGSLLGSLDQQQLNATAQNADLRKKLRIDRVKKMTMGNAAATASIEDPRQPDWMKHKSLREIEIIRETKKTNILNQVFGVEGDSGAPSFNVTPGQLSFLPVPIINHSNTVETYSVKFDDPDLDMLGGPGYGEFSLVSNGAEFRHWVSLNKVNRPPKWDNITRTGDVMLEPGQHMDILVKFLTIREVSLSKSVNASKYVIKPRRVRILIMARDMTIRQSIEVNVVPSIAPIDHTFRFYEPEQSHYSVVLPPFIQLNQPGISVMVSDPECKADVLADTSYIAIGGLTEEAMNTTQMTLFVYGDQFKSELLATCRIEIHARPVIYSRARVGHQAQHTLTLPALHARTIRVYSNKPSEVFQTGSQAGEAIRLIPNSLNHVNMWVKIEKQQRSPAPTLVNCIDQHSGELIYSWLLIIETVV